MLPEIRLAWLCLLMVAPSSWAAPVRTLTFDEAIALALERNIPLRQAETAAELSTVAVSEAHGQFLPDLTLDTAGSKNYGRNFNSATGTVTDETTRSLTLGASSGLTMFAGFRDLATLRQAKLNARAGGLDLGRARETAILTVASNFLSLIQLQDQLRVQRENLEAEATLETQIRHFVEAGARAQSDLYQEQANVSSARLAMVGAQNAAELAKVDLMRTLQLDPLGVYEFQAPDVETLLKSTEPTEMPDLLARALARRPDLRAAEARVAAAEQSLRIARAGYWPTVALQAGYGSSYTDAVPTDFHDQLDIGRGGSVGLNVSIPLFDRGATRNATRRAQLQLRGERLTLEDLRQEVGLQVKSAYLNYRAARDQLTEAETGQGAAQRAVQSAQERFKKGAAILVELTQARAVYVLAESALVAARTNFLLQRTLMSYSLGEISAHALDAAPPPTG